MSLAANLGCAAHEQGRQAVASHTDFCESACLGTAQSERRMEWLWSRMTCMS